MLKIKFHYNIFSTFFHYEEALTSVWPPAGGRVVNNLRSGWSQSIVLENEVVLNFYFRNGAEKSGPLDRPWQGYGQIYFSTFRYILRKAGLLWFATRYIKNKNCFVNDTN